MYTYIRHYNEGANDSPLVTLDPSVTVDAEVWANMRIDATAAVPSGQPGQLIVDVGAADLGVFRTSSFWYITIKDKNDATIATLDSDVHSVGTYGVDVIVGEAYDVYYWMHGEEGGFPQNIAEYTEQYLTFSATGNVYVPPTPGDTNGDHLVDRLDYLNLVDQFGGTPGAESADFNGDGSVDLIDFAFLRGLLGSSIASAPDDMFGATIPEPATLTLLALSGLAVLRKRRKK